MIKTVLNDNYLQECDVILKVSEPFFIVFVFYGLFCFNSVAALVKAVAYVVLTGINFVLVQDAVSSSEHPVLGEDDGAARSAANYPAIRLSVGGFAGLEVA